MNSKTFDSLFNRKELGFTSLRMEAYGNNCSGSTRKIPCVLRWKVKVYRQLFYVTNANNSSNLLARDGCYTLGVIKPSYLVETDSSCSQFQGILQAVPTHLPLTWRKQMCKVSVILIVKVKELSQKTRAVPGNAAS